MTRRTVDRHRPLGNWLISAGAGVKALIHVLRTGAISLRVGIGLLVLLIGASIAGTLVTPLERAQRIVYYSWWFETLLLLVAVNISAATIQRMVSRARSARRFEFQRSGQFYEATKPSVDLPYDGTVDGVAEGFRRRGFRTATQGPCGCARKGTLGQWGAAIAHAGVVIVLVASFAAGFLARTGGVVLREGESTDRMLVSEDPAREAPLGFTIRCDDFETGFFPKTRIVSCFISTIAILRGRQRTEFGQVEVNGTVRTHGWTIHQAGWDELHGVARYRVSVQGAGSGPVALDISPGQKRGIPGMAEFEIELGKSLPLAYRIWGSGREVAEGAVGGAGGVRLRLLAEQFEPDFVMGPGGGWRVRFLGRAPAYQTVLTLTRNPVIPFIYSGCTAIVAGLLGAFFIRRRTVHFWVDACAGRLRVAGVYRHAAPDFDRAARRVLADLGASSARHGA